MTIERVSSGLADAVELQQHASPNAALVATAEHIAGLGVYEWDLDHGTSWGSRVFFEIHGIAAGDQPALGGPMDYGRFVHRDDRRAVTQLMADVARGTPLRSPHLEWRIVRGGRCVRRVRSTVTIVRREGSLRGRVVGTLQDITDSSSAEIGLELHLAAAAATSGFPAASDPVETMLEQLALPLAAEVAVLWTVRPEERALRARALWTNRDGAEAGHLRAAVDDLKFRRGEGLVGRVWTDLTPLATADLLAGDGHVRRSIRTAPGLTDSLAFPVRGAGELTAVIELHLRSSPPMTAVLAAALLTVGDRLGDFFARHRATFGQTPITERECEVLQLAAEGFSIPAIAVSLAVSESTVKTHLEHLHLKLGVKNRPAAVAQGLREGLIR